MKNIMSVEPWKSSTFLITTNNLSTLEEMDRVVVLREGRMTFFGTLALMRDREDLKDYYDSYQEMMDRKTQSIKDQKTKKKEVKMRVKLC